MKLARVIGTVVAFIAFLRGLEVLGAVRTAILSTLDIVPLQRSHLERAGTMLPPALRTLDALHLSVALDLGPGLIGFVTYDERQAEAAREHAVTVTTPT